MLTLPALLQQEIETILKREPSQRWIRAAQELSERYRAERVGGEAALAHGPEQALGYLALIFPAAYAQLVAAMAATAARVPDWQPTSLLDLGSGPGTALWAAVNQWPSIKTVTAWEREPALINLGKALAKQHPTLADCHWERRDLQAFSAEGQQYDLVVIGHVLNELAPILRDQLIDQLWARTSGMLLIVEPGTSYAFPIVRAARDRLLAAGAHTIAPCPHHSPCPLSGDWCHFSQRLERPEFQRRARGAPSTWEDAKLSYAAMARFEPALPIAARVIREPIWNKAYAEAQICSGNTVQLVRALKRNRTAFQQVKELVWGQALEEAIDLTAEV